MISMDKKYRTRDGRNVRLLCTDGPDHRFPVVGFASGDPISTVRWSSEGAIDGFPRPLDLIEVLPEVVTWAVIDKVGCIYWASTTVAPSGRGGLATLRFTTRNGGKSHTDVTVDVLPVDYVEPTP